MDQAYATRCRGFHDIRKLLPEPTVSTAKVLGTRRYRNVAVQFASASVCTGSDIETWVSGPSPEVKVEAVPYERFRLVYSDLTENIWYFGKRCLRFEVQLFVQKHIQFFYERLIYES